MTYPIIEQHSLRAAEKSGPWGLGGRRRLADELPTAGPHQVLVYKYGGRYIVDDGLGRLKDEHVSEATNVSVVDMRDQAPITVRTAIPSAGAGEFTIQVTFLCTVRKPDEVVDSGLLDMTGPLLHYLTMHQPLFHLGEDSEFEDVNEVRKSVTAQVKAYVSVRPPRYRGIDVGLGSVQVLTPDELAAFESTRRAKRHEAVLASEDQHREHELASERQDLDHLLDGRKNRYVHELERDNERHQQQLADMRREMDEMQELQRRRHEQLVEGMRQQIEQSKSGFERAEEVRKDRHERQLNEEQSDHVLASAEKLRDALGADTASLLPLLALAAGDISATETAAVLDRDRQLEREEKVAERAWQREKALREATWQREDSARRRVEEREDRRFELEIKLQVLRKRMETVQTAIERGLADQRTIDDVEHLIDGLIEELQEPAKRMLDSAGEGAAESAAPEDQAKRPRGEAAHNADVLAADVTDRAEDAKKDADGYREGYVVREEDIGA